MRRLRRIGIHADSGCITRVLAGRRRRVGRQKGLLIEQIGERKAADPAARAEKEFAAVPEISRAAMRHRPYLIYRNSLRFRTTCVNDASDRFTIKSVPIAISASVGGRA